MATVDSLAHRNLCDFTRLLARLENGTLHDQHGIVANAGHSDFPSSRSAVRSDTGTDAAAWAAEAIGFFDAHGKTASISARVGLDDDITDVLLTHNFREWSQSPEMICEQPLAARDLPEGVRVRLAETPTDVADYARIAGEAFAHLMLPAEMTVRTVDRPDIMLAPDCVIALADLDGEPVAGAIVALFGAEPLGYVGWVACADKARGRGLGELVTRRVTNEAFERGAQLVTLEASKFGEHTYARMGYREIYRYRMLIRL